MPGQKPPTAETPVNGRGGWSGNQSRRLGLRPQPTAMGGEEAKPYNLPGGPGGDRGGGDEQWATAVRRARGGSNSCGGSRWRGFCRRSLLRRLTGLLGPPLVSHVFLARRLRLVAIHKSRRGHARLRAFSRSGYSARHLCRATANQLVPSFRDARLRAFPRGGFSRRNRLKPGDQGP